MTKRRYEDVDLGYTLYCVLNGVSSDPIGWLHEDRKEVYTRQAKEFLKELGLKSP